ncbi:Baculoviral IAP repeat-containing protein 7-B [Holothuria leucospilota]|uniref:Baculoviral IAP repeat-containing protein 7-B n=1 Tax=Holothuria leucospilota TaxID=206669 RepID=A0A9Q1BIV7_HOLLE|nr:Baculoviral IAP repeat-containing protein 7-B [Holothuria leucospilota]
MSGYHVVAFAATVAVGIGLAIYAYIKSKPVLVKESQYQGSWQYDYEDDNESEDLEELKRKNRCTVCMSKNIGVLFSPCNHLVTCTDCGSKMNVCPVCRRKVRKRINAYLP